MNTADAGLWVRTAGFIAAGSLLWLTYFDLKDVLRPEPRRRLAVAFLAGVGAAVLAIGLYRGVAWLGAPAGPRGGPAAVALYCLFLVGPIEEGAKFLVARAVCFRWREFDERIDGLVYAGAVGLGFAALENVLFLRALPWGEGLVRALVSPLTHSLFAAVWGFGAGRALLTRRGAASRWSWQAGTLLLSMLLHGAYDAAAVGYGATVPAAAIVAVVWAFVIWNARRIVKSER